MDDELDGAEVKSEELANQLEELEKSADEHDQARKILQNGVRNDSAKIEALEKELSEINEKLADYDSRCEQYTQESKYFS